MDNEDEKQTACNNFTNNGQRKRKLITWSVSLTDSDNELYEAARALSPSPSRKTTNQVTYAVVPLKRSKTYPPPILHKFPTRTTDVRSIGNGISTIPKWSGSSTKAATIEDLPDEIMEEILCHLSAADLINSCSLINRRFNSIISQSTFLPWKKLYARYSLKDTNSSEELETFVVKMTKQLDGELGPKHLIKFMSTVHKMSDDEAAVGLARISAHPQFKSAVEMINRILSNTEMASNSTKLGAMVTTFVLLSPSVEFMMEIIRSVTNRPFCKTIYWIEYFYCLLTMLEYFTRQEILKDGRHHYQLQYAVFLLEIERKRGEIDANHIGRRSPVTNRTIARPSKSFINRSSAQSRTDYVRSPLTEEQLRIVNYDLQPNDYVRIIAFAGTGKTTTLLEYCLARPETKFLIVFYNTAIADEARKRVGRAIESKLYPSRPDGNVPSCRTIHSLAYRAVGRKFEHQLVSEISIYNIRNHTMDVKKANRYVRLGLIRQTLYNYFASDQDDITSLIVPDEWSYKDRDGFPQKLVVDLDLKVEISNQAARYWTLMKDPSKPAVPITHDGYLKIFQLSEPILSEWDVLLIDEAQDCNPAALDIFKGQTHMPKILVGDGYQQIYSFRGAINALESVPATKTFYLTQSFRFGPEIAYLANAWMRSMLGEGRKFLIGTDKPSRLDGVGEGQWGIVCRTNFEVFNESIAIAERVQARCIFMGPPKKQNGFFRPLEALFYVSLSEKSRKSEQKPIHWYVNKFESLVEAKEYAEEVVDKELLCRLAVLNRHGIHTGSKIRTIKSRLVDQQAGAQYVVITAHRSKGLEFDKVRLANDFDDLDNPLVNAEGDEKNLVYVAITRAKKNLGISDTVRKMLMRRLGSILGYPVLPATNEPSGEQSTKISCTKCQQAIDSRKHLLVTPIGATIEIKFCKACVEQAMINEINNGLVQNGNDSKLRADDSRRCYTFYLPFLD